MPKKTMILFCLIFTVIFLNSSIVFAGDIRLEINGETVTNSLDYRIEKDNILIPVDILSDHLDIKKTWYSSIETMKLEFEDKIVKLRSGDRNIQVNDSLIRMPVATTEVNGDIYVPLQEISEALGLMLNSDHDRQVVEIYEVKERVKEVNHLKNNGYEAIEILTSERIDYDISYLDKPQRIVFDLKGTIISEQDAVDIDSKLINRARIAQYNGNTTRIVLDLSGEGEYLLSEDKKDGYYTYKIKVNPIIKDIDFVNSTFKLDSTAPLENTEITYLENPYRAVIDISNASINEGMEFYVGHDLIKKARLDQYKTEPTNIVRMVVELEEDIKTMTQIENGSLLVRTIQSELKYVDYDSNKSVVDFNLTRQIEPKIMTLEAGNRVIFDFPETINKFDKSKISINDKFIEEIRVAQFSDTTTRVVLDLNRFIPYDMEWDKDSLSVALLNQLNEIMVSETTGEVNISLGLTTKGNYTTNKLLGPPRLVVDIMDTVVDTGHLKISNQSDLIKDIRTSQYSINPKQTRVVFDLEDDFEFEINSSPMAEKIELAVKEHDFTEKTIVLDAGHGGIDPGALGYSGLQEKEVALKITLMLEEMLTEAGFNVILTREDDYFVDLIERANLANEKDADLLLSIHLNAHRNPNVKGTETYVANNADDKSNLFAKYIQENILEELGTLDRGIKEDSLYVLSDSEVPAVLSEAAFLTNRTEEEMLRDEENLQKIALALYKSFSQYFEAIAEEEL